MENLIEKWQRFSSVATDLSNVARRLPSEFDLKRLLDTIEALIQYASPFKVGDRVELTDSPVCDGGWAGSEHCLHKGALGTILECDFDPERKTFIYLFEPDDSDLYKSGLSRTAGMFLIANRRASYCFSERWFKKSDVPRPERVRCKSQLAGDQCQRLAGHDGSHTATGRVWEDIIFDEPCPTCGNKRRIT